MGAFTVKAETLAGKVVTLRKGFSSREDAEDHPVKLSQWKRVWVDEALPPMTTKAQRKADYNRRWIENSLDKLHADRALFALAEMLTQDWCANWRGPPSDIGDLIALRCSLEPPATTLLRNLTSMPDDDRRALAHRLWPVGRTTPATEKG